MFSIWDKVIFFGYSEYYEWKLKRCKEYVVKNKTFDENTFEDFISIGYNNNEISWFKEKDFLSIVKYRKLKLKFLKE